MKSTGTLTVILLVNLFSISFFIVLSSLPKDVRRKQGFIEAGRNTLDELYKFARGLLESGIHSEAINPYEEYCKAVERPLIQGSAADMSKRAMILLGQNEELKSLGFKMLFPVHNSLVLLVQVK